MTALAVSVSGTPTFLRPPIVELVLGVQFSPLTKLTSGHYGLFWKELGDGWDDASDELALEDQFEQFGGPRASAPGLMRNPFRIIRGPGLGRFVIKQAKDRLVQLQPTRFHLNWRKGNDFYPSYKFLIGEFEERFNLFRSWALACGLGDVAPNQWEITYVDAFPIGEYWESVADWPNVLPGLFGKLFAEEDDSLAFEHRTAEWRFEIKPRRGRLHVRANLGRWHESEALMLTMTARGPVGEGGVDTLRDGLDLGHEVCVNSFLRVAKPELQARWGEIV